MAPTVGQIYDPATLPLRIVSSVLRVLGIIVTTWRIYFRLSIYRFWWEDAWAAVVLLSCLVSLVGEWVYLLTYDLSSNIGYWLYVLGSICVLKAVRANSATYLSVLFSIIRILPRSRLRRFACVYTLFCFICGIVLVSGAIWYCASNPSWHHDQPPACLLPSQLVIFAFTSNCVTVAILIAIPLSVLWRVRLPRRQRRMILSAFASSVVLAFVAVLRVVGDVLLNDMVLVAGADLKDACAIIVCNLLVVVTYVYRFLCRDSERSDTTTTSEPDSDDFTQPRRQFDSTLTTVQIDTFMTQNSWTSLRTCSVPTDSACV